MPDSEFVCESYGRLKWESPIRVLAEAKPNRLEGDGGSGGSGGWKNTTKPKHELTSNKTRDRDSKLNTTNSEKELCKG